MKFRVGVLAIIALSPAMLSGQQKVGRRMAVDADASIRIVNLAGRTRIIGWERDSVVVTGTVATGSGTFFMGGGRRGVKVGIEAADPTASPPEALLEIRVPRRARVWVKSATAPVSVEGVAGGEVDVYSVSGSVTVGGSPRLLTAESMDGAVEVTAQSQVMRLKSAGGDITLQRPAGDVTVSSVSGVVRVLDPSGLASARLESISGGVVFRGGLVRGGTLDLQTHDGPIEIMLPPSQGAVLDVSTFGGTVRNLVPGAAITIKGKSARHAVGDENARITVRSLKGNVLIRSRMIRPNVPG